MLTLDAILKTTRQMTSYREGPAFPDCERNPHPKLTAPEEANASTPHNTKDKP